jgi:putative MATE family efflux protein
MKNTAKPDNKGQQRREAMGRDPIWSLIARFSIPSIISMTVASSYQLVDAIFVGRLGAEALAAMSVTYPLMMSLVAIASGTGAGVTSLISRSLGAGDQEKANRTAAVAISLCLILSGIIFLTCLPSLDFLLRTLGARDAVLPLARSYAEIQVMLNIFSYLSMIFSFIIRADGNPVFSSSVGIGSALLNVVLDPVFIFGFAFIPAMGIRGAAIATVISQVLSTLVFLGFIISGRTAYRFRIVDFIPDLRIIGGIYRVGVASIVRSGAQFVVMGVINNTAAAFGVIPLAIMGVLTRAGRFIQMPLLGLGQGTLPVIGFNFGAKKFDRVSELVIKSIVTGSAWSILCWIAVMVFPTQIMSAFSGESQFMTEGTAAIRLYSLAYFTLGLRMVPGNVFQAMGKGLPATVLTAAQTVGFLLPAVIFMSGWFGLTGLWLAFPVADILGLILGQVWLNIELRKQGIKFFRRQTQDTVIPKQKV